MQLFSTILLLLLPLISTAQGKNDHVWLIGYGDYNIPPFGGTRLDFNSGHLETTGFALPEQFELNGAISISDDKGVLQFYTNGCRIVNASGETIKNGDSLSLSHLYESSCHEAPYNYIDGQLSLVLPRPGHPGHYFYLHSFYEGYSIDESSFLCSEIDMNADGGSGAVIVKDKKLLGLDMDLGSITAVRHGNGRDWWVLIQENRTNIYNLFLVMPDQILGPYVQDWENEVAMHDGKGKAGWNCTFSRDGTRFARVSQSYQAPDASAVYLYDFDRCSGVLSNPKRITLPEGDPFAAWAEFSPNGRFLYLQIEQSRLYQYDLWSEDIQHSGILVGEYDGFRDEYGASGKFFSMAVAPDNRIYISTTSATHYYHTIHSPDSLGLACDFRQHDVNLPTVSNVFMPNFPNYRLYDIPGSICDTLGIDSPYPAYPKRQTQPPEMLLFPNPATNMVNLYVGEPAPGKLRIYNVLGQLVYEQVLSGTVPTTAFSVDGWVKGTYFVEVVAEGGRHFGKKLVVAPQE